MLTAKRNNDNDLYTQRNGSYGLLINSKTDKWDHLTEHSNKKFFEITNCHVSILKT